MRGPTLYGLRRGLVHLRCGAGLLHGQRAFHAGHAVAGHRAEELVGARLEVQRQRLGPALERRRGAEDLCPRTIRPSRCAPAGTCSSCRSTPCRLWRSARSCCISVRLRGWLPGSASVPWARLAAWRMPRRWMVVGVLAAWAGVEVSATSCCSRSCRSRRRVPVLRMRRSMLPLGGSSGRRFLRRVLRSSSVLLVLASPVAYLGGAECSSSHACESAGSRPCFAAQRVRRSPAGDHPDHATQARLIRRYIH